MSLRSINHLHRGLKSYAAPRLPSGDTFATIRPPGATLAPLRSAGKRVDYGARSWRHRVAVSTLAELRSLQDAPRVAPCRYADLSGAKVAPRRSGTAPRRSEELLAAACREQTSSWSDLSSAKVGGEKSRLWSGIVAAPGRYADLSGAKVAPDGSLTSLRSLRLLRRCG